MPSRALRTKESVFHRLSPWGEVGAQRRVRGLEPPRDRRRVSPSPYPLPGGEREMNPRSSDGPLDIRIYLLALGTFALGTDVFVIAGILPMIASDLGVSV